MRYGSILATSLAGSVALTTVALAPILAQGKGGGDEPATLTLAVFDPTGRQSEPAVQFLVRRIAELSDGSITIVPTFNAGDGTRAGGEVGVAELVESGGADLGMLGTRAWDLAGVTSMRGLQAPFVIDNDALSLAVARSDISARALDDMGNGVTGLAMWPEDLRHLFAFSAGGHTFTTPEDVRGAQILVIPSAASRSVVSALGATIYDESTGDRSADADSGALSGMETGLWGAGLPRQDVTVAGDVVLFPKYQSLTANDQSLARLTDHQRELLIQAVTEMQADAFTRQFTETELASDLCASGATVVEAGPAAVAAFAAAAQPAMDAMEQDPFTQQLITDILALKAVTPASAGAGTCEPPTATASGDAAASSAPVTALPPDGTYRVTVTPDDLMAAGADRTYASENAGTLTWVLDGGASTITFEGDTAEPCRPTLAVVDGLLRVTFRGDAACSEETLDVVWSLDDQGGLALQVIAADPESALVDERSVFQRTWARIDASSAASPSQDAVVVTSLPPDGTYRATFTPDELVAAGASRSYASQNAGTWTWVLDGGGSTIQAEGDTAPCMPSLAVEDDRLRVTFTDANCSRETLDMLWSMDDAGDLVLQVLAADPPGVLSDERAVFQRTWTRAR